MIVKQQNYNKHRPNRKTLQDVADVAVLSDQSASVIESSGIFHKKPAKITKILYFILSRNTRVLPLARFAS